MSRVLRHPILALVTLAFLAAASGAAPVAVAGTDGTCLPGYSYGAAFGARAAYGVAASVVAEEAPTVDAGHVGAWVGVGGAGLGPGGTDAWIQVGVAAFPGERPRLYVEVARPGELPELRDLGVDVAAGDRHRLAVLEQASRPGRWRVWIDGQPVGEPVYLPGTSGTFAPIVAAESWDGGRGACNRFRFRFEQPTVAERPGGRWRPFATGATREDPGYRLSRDGTALVAASAG